MDVKCWVLVLEMGFYECTVLFIPCPFNCILGYFLHSINEQHLLVSSIRGENTGDMQRGRIGDRRSEGERGIEANSLQSDCLTDNHTQIPREEKE